MLQFVLGKIGVKGIVMGLAAIAVTGIITLGYRHYTGLVDDKAQLTADKAALESQVAQLNANVATYEEELRTWQLREEERTQQLEEQRRIAEAAQREARRLNGIFAEHDLTRLTLAKPGLIERRVNAGTARVQRMFECASAGTCPDG